jgi:hypothetical protein
VGVSSQYAQLSVSVVRTLCLYWVIHRHVSFAGQEWADGEKRRSTHCRHHKQTNTKHRIYQ